MMRGERQWMRDPIPEPDRHLFPKKISAARHASMAKVARNPSGASSAGFMLALCLVAIGRAGDAAEPTDFSRCAPIKSDRDRLKCYDAAAGRSEAKAAEPLQQLGAAPPPQAASGAVLPTALSARWELEPETKQGVWEVRPYQPMFILPVRYTNNSNKSPQSPSHPDSESAPLDSTEFEFQLSLKVKAAQNMFGTQADLWFAYTQQSQWQVYNGGTSRPFRETDYQPEMFVLIPTRYDLLGLTGRFASLGLVHQSNGRADPLSRSWNRVYAQFGFERGDFALLVRPWYRLKEDTTDDDNPDIEHYLGHGDVTAIYQSGRQEFSLLGRYNNGSGKGAAQGTWSFPIQGRLKGYVKLFNGYGETLIDYNWNQTTIGIGILLVDWL
jgi:phospholipase A1